MKKKGHIMKKRNFLGLYLMVMIATIGFTDRVSAQQEGVITSSLLEKMRKTDIDQGKINAISNNSINDLILNRSNVGKIDHYFKVKLDIKGITDQESSGRCWLFTSLNVIRQKAREKFNLESFEFSENYSFFWDQLEKSNLFLENIIKTRDKKDLDQKVRWLFQHPVSDGGVWNMAVGVIKKYGLVPKSVMPETYHSSHTRDLSSILCKKLREDGIRLRQMHEQGKSVNSLRKAKEEMLIDIYKILVFHMGEPPAEFIWRYKDKDGNISEPKTYTPLEFFRETVDVGLNDYVMLMNDPTRDYYKLYEIEYYRDMVEGINWKYINLPNEKLKEFAQKSLLEGEALYHACDVGKQLNREEGLLSLKNYDYEALYGIKFEMNKKERILTAGSGSSHGMALVGFEKDKEGNITKWLLENSWGPKSGHQGYLTMTDEWFDEYTFRLVVHKKYVSSDVLKILETEPILLEPWDPMFLPMEDK
jgi:bleomycin hydrolase